MSDSDDAIENYDDLAPEPSALVQRPSSSRPTSQRDAPSLPPLTMDVGVKHRRSSSIQVTLEPTSKKGQFVLTADDPEIREILRRGLEREEAEARGMKPRNRFRDYVFTRQFTTFDRQNSSTAESPFFGFFTLFWIAMAGIILQAVMKNYRDSGNILGSNQVMKLMFSRDVLVLGITEGVIWAATFEGYLFQKLVQHGYINWSKSGWIIQNVWQATYLLGLIGWTYFREWPWTHTIFAVLHGLVFVMKQHSYAFYNGYLSGVYRRRRLLEHKLRQLEAIVPISSPPTSPRESHQAGYLSTAVDSSELSKTVDSTTTTSQRRPVLGPRTSTNLASESSIVAKVAAAIESKQPIDAEQVRNFSRIIKLEIDELSKELQGKSEDGKNAYPHNLRFLNLVEFTCLPTLVYELEYPRAEKINWWYVLEKTVATFGVLGVMQSISQAFIYPLVAKTYAMKAAGASLETQWRELPFIVSDMLFPMLLEQLLTWYLIWECILNVLAELTYFADRGFYGAWWNTVTWDQYARDWNRPVHNFLLRHVYNSSISSFHLSRQSATFVTFLLSALVHEMCMALIFKKVRGYLFWLQMTQMGLAAFGRSKLMKGRVILGNVMFWMGLFIGPSLLASLYLVV